MRPWAAIEAAASDIGRGFQELADEAFADLLKKHKQPVGLKASLEQRVGTTVKANSRPAASRRRSR